MSEAYPSESAPPFIRVVADVMKRHHISKWRVDTAPERGRWAINVAVPGGRIPEPIKNAVLDALKSYFMDLDVAFVPLPPEPGHDRPWQEVVESIERRKNESYAEPDEPEFTVAHRAMMRRLLADLRTYLMGGDWPASRWGHVSPDVAIDDALKGIMRP